MNEVFKIIINYSKKVQKLDEEAIRRIINIIVKERNLENYLNDIFIQETFGAELLFASAAFISAEKALYFSTCNMNYNAHMQLNDYKREKLTSPFEETLFTNIIFLQTILHELEHVKQIQIEESGNGIEQELVNLSCSPEIRQTIESYKYKPTERLAEIKSWGSICAMLTPIKEIYPALYHFAEKKKKEKITDAYVNGIGFVEEGPTYHYARLVSPSREFSIPSRIKTIQELEKDFDGTEVRLIYGLPVSEHEYHSYISKK